MSRRRANTCWFCRIFNLNLRNKGFWAINQIERAGVLDGIHEPEHVGSLNIGLELTRQHQIVCHAEERTPAGFAGFSTSTFATRAFGPSIKLNEQVYLM